MVYNTPDGRYKETKQAISYLSQVASADSVESVFNLLITVNLKQKKIEKEIYSTIIQAARNRLRKFLDHLDSVEQVMKLAFQCSLDPELKEDNSSLLDPLSRISSQAND